MTSQPEDLVATGQVFGQTSIPAPTAQPTARARPPAPPPTPVQATIHAAPEPTGEGAVATELGRLVEDPRVGSRLTVTGPADVLPSLYRVTAAAVISVAAAAEGAGRLLAARSCTEPVPIAVDTRHAAAAFRSERLLRIDGAPPNQWDPISGHYRTGDGRWIHLDCAMPHHRNGVLAMFGVPNDRAAVARAVARHDAAELEAELQALGTCAAMARSELDWMAHPAGLALAELPLLEIERIGDGPRSSGAVARPPAAGRPADGVRVLDMSRVIAGPVCGRTLAGYGADVLRVGAAHLTDSRTLVIDTGLGKRSTFLNLRVAADARRMRELVATADVVVQAYRPRALDRLGFGPDELARLRPGIVCATISAYGRLGPWSGLRGFDGLVQTASGIAVAAAAASDSDRPLPLPAAALDHATGYLAAYGVLAALARRHVEGGSWQVRLSLAQTGRWLVGLGEHDTLAGADPTPAEQAGLRRTMHTEFGEISYIAPPGEVAGISPAYDTPPSSLGAHEAAWVTTTP